MAKKTGRKKEESLVMVGPGSDDEDEDHDAQLESEDEDDEKDDDEGEDDEDSDAPRKKKPKAKKSDEDEDGDSDEDDERVGHGEEDEEDDEDGKSKKRDRESRKARRERQRKARQRNEVELNFLRQQNERLESEIKEVKGRVDRTEVGSVDQRITSIQSQLKVADQVLAKAHENGSGEDVVEATNIRDRLKETLGRLNGAKQELARRAEESEQEPAVDSRLVYHASQWMRSHSWYDPSGTDKDSRRVASIDDRLVKEGYDPRSPEYWDELTDRVREALPHKFKDRRNGNDEDDDLDEDDDRESRGNGKARRGSGPRFSTGGRERPLRKNEVYVSPERKQALIDAGVWDDPVLRSRYLKKYKDWDKDNAPRRSAR
jgi:hypothetical protein